MTTTSPSMPPSPASGPGPAGGSRRRWLVILAAAVATLLVLAVTATALSAEPGPPPGAGSSVAGSSTAATAFTASTLSGGEVAVPGGKPSVVFFFSVTCGTCGPGARALAEAQASTPDVNYVAVDIDPNESVNDVREFLTANDASTLSYARDTDASLTRAYQLTQLSTAVVLDAAGTEVYRGVDPTTSQIRSALSKAGVE
ncbi:redoxin family protein [Nostocoides sp. Soil756]|uniref:TlpA family protein disulfide reductase n=1 Tax=Nostocoides sp. Soil756 TaxID=1736399 RepID=UPI000ADED76B|nr:redoxin family protein [Tetrasphaera sp. Soil756]